MMKSYWWNEKLYHYTHKQLCNIWMTAKISRKRCYLWGGLATFAWLCGISQLEAPQKSGRIWPHFGMFIAAGAIAKTTSDHLKKAHETQTQVKNLLRDLRRSKNPLNIEEIYHATQNLTRAYPVIYEYEKE